MQFFRVKLQQFELKQNYSFFDIAFFNSSTDMDCDVLKFPELNASDRACNFLLKSVSHFLQLLEQFILTQ